MALEKVIEIDFEKLIDNVAGSLIKFIKMITNINCTVQQSSFVQYILYIFIHIKLCGYILYKYRYF